MTRRRPARPTGPRGLRTFRGARSMRGLKPSLALAAFAVVGLAVWAGARVENSANRMATAADRFLSSLDSSQVAEATFPFDSPERINWHFIPRPRKGLAV